MLRTGAIFACLLSLAGLAAADVAPDYPVTQNSYRFELAAAEGFDAEGVHLVVVTRTKPRKEKEWDQVKVQAAGTTPISVPRWHWSREMERELVLVRGDLPAKLDKAWLESATVLAKLDVGTSLSSSERAKDDHENYKKQTYTLRVTPKLKGDALALSVAKTQVSRMDADGKVLSVEKLNGKETGSVLPRSGTNGLLGFGALLGLLGLGGLTLARRRTTPVA